MAIELVPLLKEIDKPAEWDRAWKAAVLGLPEKVAGAIRKGTFPPLAITRLEGSDFRPAFSPEHGLIAGLEKLSVPELRHEYTHFLVDSQVSFQDLQDFGVLLDDFGVRTVRKPWNEIKRLEGLVGPLEEVTKRKIVLQEMMTIPLLYSDDRILGEPEFSGIFGTKSFLDKAALHQWRFAVGHYWIGGAIREEKP